MQVKDLSIEEFKDLIRDTVEEVLNDLLVDPDAGQPLKDTIRQQLLQQRTRRAHKKETLSSQQVMEELGWH
jgi:hypothetical protein